MADDFDRFTKRSRRVITLAQSEARRLNHNHIGTEHLLLGFTMEDGGFATDILQILGISLPLLREQMERHIEPGRATVQQDLAFTQQMKTVIELAINEANRFNYDYVGSEHLLAGLLRENNSFACWTLKEMGISLDKVRSQMRLNQKEKMLNSFTISQPSFLAKLRQWIGFTKRRSS